VFDSAGKMRNMADIIEDLEDKLLGMSDEQRKVTQLMLGFTDKSWAFMQTLLGTSEAIRGYEASLRKAGGLTKQVADKQLTPLQKGFAKLSAAAVELGTIFVDTVGPALADIMELVGGLLKLMRTWVPWILRLGAAMIAIRAAIWLVNVALRAYALWQKRATMWTMMSQAAANPAAWAKLAASVAAAGVAIAAMNKMMGKIPDLADKGAAAAAKLKDEMGKIGAAGGPGVADKDPMAQRLEEYRRMGFKGDEPPVGYPPAMLRGTQEAWGKVLEATTKKEGKPLEKIERHTKETADHLSDVKEALSRGESITVEWDRLDMPPA
jgi:hypothetical protein